MAIAHVLYEDTEEGTVKVTLAGDPTITEEDVVRAREYALSDGEDTTNLTEAQFTAIALTFDLMSYPIDEDRKVRDRWALVRIEDAENDRITVNLQSSHKFNPFVTDWKKISNAQEFGARAMLRISELAEEGV